MIPRDGSSANGVNSPFEGEDPKLGGSTPTTSNGLPSIRMSSDNSRRRQQNFCLHSLCVSRLRRRIRCARQLL